MAMRAYRLLARCLVPLLLAYLWWRGRKDPDYRLRWPERLGRATAGHPAPPHGVMLHCASVGEVIAARALVQALLADPLTGPLLLTCSTPTGARQIRTDFADRVALAYFPFDAPGAVRRFLAHWQPRLVLLMERELWPEFLHQTQCRGIPVALVNARLSERSAAGYRRWHTLMTPALQRLRLVCAEDSTAAKRFEALGISPQRLRVTGNLKSDVTASPALRQRIAHTRGHLGTRPVLTAGSTHPGEDEALLAAFVRHLEQHGDTLLVLVPRHPERFTVVAALLDASGLRYQRASQRQPLAAATQVLLGDTMGELMHWYGVADVCFIGGSLVPRGGHNPLEAVCLDKPVLTGPHTANFDTLYAQLEQAGALGRVTDADAVFVQLRSLLPDPAAVAARVAAAQAVTSMRTGALQRTLDALQPLLQYAGEGAPLTQARVGPDTVWCSDDLRALAASPGLWDAAAWRERGSAEPLDGGRGGIWRVSDGQRRYLMRHYYRGGLMARISRDRFLAGPVSASRAMREFALLQALRARGLPVPRPAAARCQAAALGYRADILVELIPDAADVARLLHRERALVPDEWRRLGQAIRRLHDAQVHHSDLNCHNLMLDARGCVWIVDFDQCGFRPDEAWKQENLARLLRSLRKELRLDPGFRWDDSQWAPLLAGYTQAPEEPGDAQPRQPSA